MFFQKQATLLMGAIDFFLDTPKTPLNDNFQQNF